MMQSFEAQNSGKLSEQRKFQANILTHFAYHRHQDRAISREHYNFMHFRTDGTT
jgi:hypothetical protein